MAAVDLDVFDRLVLSEVRRAPRALVAQKLIEVMRDFCSITRCWQEATTDDLIAAGLAEYDVDAPFSDAEVIAIEYVAVDGNPSIAKDLDWLDSHVTSWRTQEADNFTYYTSDERGTILFASIPLTGGQTLEYRASFQPKIDADQIEDTVFNQWGEQIAYGVKAELLGMVGEPWANPDRAAKCHGKYLTGRSHARMHAQKRYNRVAQTFMSPYRFGGR